MIIRVAPAPLAGTPSNRRAPLRLIHPVQTCRSARARQQPAVAGPTTTSFAVNVRLGETSLSLRSAETTVVLNAPYCRPRLLARCNARESGWDCIRHVPAVEALELLEGWPTLCGR